MDITPRVTAGKATIDTYGGGGFSAQSKRVDGPALLFPGSIEPWQGLEDGNITLQSLQPFLAIADELDVVLVGCGERMQFLSKDIRQAFDQAGVGIDAMDTGAACRTFNILQIEERRVAAALLPVE